MVERDRIHILWVTFFTAACIVGMAGCETRRTTLSTGPATDSAAPTGTVGAEDSAGLTAEQILDRMLTAYRTAKSYRDDATITLSYRQGGRMFSDEAPIAVTFQRPDRLRVRAYQVTLASDGQQLRGFIADPSTRNIDGQFLARPVPERLQLATLLDDPLLADQLGNALVSADAGRIPLQLAFLLSTEPVTLLADKDTHLSRLEPGPADGRDCLRIEATTLQGKFVFWIDRQDFLLRRLEYPRKALVARIADDQEVKDLQLVANFHKASFSDAADPESFELPIPAGAKQVRFFVPPPQPLPSDKFGKVFDALSLATPDGEKVTSESLTGRVAVLLWFSSHAECESALRQFAEVHGKFADEARLAFYVVSTEPSAVSHQQLRELLKSWQVSTPLARDVAAQGRDLLDINNTPTLVVLDGEGALQLYEVGVNPQMSQQLPQVLEKLLQGEDVAAAILQQQELEQQQ